MNLVAIDPSLTNSAMAVNGRLFSFPSTSMARTKKGELTKWFDLCEPLATFHEHSFDYPDHEYSTVECQKLYDYQWLANQIVTTMASNLVPGSHTKVAIEGYSYSSAAGPLIDLVTFGTILRYRLLYHDGFASEVEVVSPTQLKSRAAAMAYPGVTKSKKTIHRNKQGLAGGQFKKCDMYKAIIENEKFDDDWTNFLRTHAEDVLNYKSIPKPIEDLNDAYLLYKSMLERV
jgi:hypothetical protein